MPVANPIINTMQRAYAGCIVTLVHVDTGETLVRHLAGYSHDKAVGAPVSRGRRRRHRRTLGVDELLRDLCEYMPRDWRIRTISSPQTIYQDLQGRTPPGRGGPDALVVAPEAQLLGRLGLLEHWEGFAEGEENQRRIVRRLSRQRRTARERGEPDT